MTSPELTARIIEWNGQKGYGFLMNNGARLFLHIRDFSERDRIPRVGDLIRFRIGHDHQGRSCAVDASHHEKLPGGRITFAHIIILLLLLILPVTAIRRFAPDLTYATYYFLGISLTTWFAYAHDKNRARIRGWRVAEIQLHFLELIGGWPAAFLAQRYLRHKTLKATYKFTFWLIILSHQYAAFDSLLNWRYTGIVATWAQGSAHSTR